VINVKWSETTTVPSHNRIGNSRTIVQLSSLLFLADSLSDSMTPATNQRTTFKLNWTRFCVTDNNFCNSLLFSIKLFSFQFHVCIHTSDIQT